MLNAKHPSTVGIRAAIKSWRAQTAAQMAESLEISRKLILFSCAMYADQCLKDNLPASSNIRRHWRTESCSIQLIRYYAAMSLVQIRQRQSAKK